MTNEKRHIHFLNDVKDLGAGYKCQRCGYACAMKTEMKWHREGIIFSECFKNQMKDTLSKIRP